MTLLGALIVLLLPGPLAGDDLDSLIAEYRKARSQSGRGGPGRGPGGRGGGRGGFGGDDRAAQQALDKIGQLGSDRALVFLLEELERAPAQFATLSARAALKSTHPRCPGVVFALLGRKPAKVALAVLDAVDPQESPSSGPPGFGRGPFGGRGGFPGAPRRAGVEVDWAKVEDELLRASRAVKEIELKRRLVPVMAKLPGPAAARGIIQTATSSSRPGPDEDLHTAAVEALVAAGANAEVRAWLEKEAFSLAKSNPGMLAVVAESTGRLKIAELRGDIEKLLSHRSEHVVMAAIEALGHLPGQLSHANVKAMARQLDRAKTINDRARILDALARDGSPGALTVVLDSAAKKDRATRAIAAGSLGLAAGNPGAVRALIALLEDDAVEVRSNALLALGKARAKELVPALIARLEKEPVDRLKADALRLLVDMTGRNMGFVVADWRQWWAGAEPGFSFARPDEGSTTRVVADSYFGIDVVSKRIAFLVDVSRSMEWSGGGGFFGGRDPQPEGKSKLDLLKEELTGLLKRLAGDAQVNIITFDGTVREWSKSLQPLSGGGRERAIAFVKGLETGLHTNVFDSLERGLADRRVDTIYLLTDGQPTTGRFVDTPGILRGVREINRVRGVAIHCIAFGEESQLLRALAAENGGVYRYVDPQRPDRGQASGDRPVEDDEPDKPGTERLTGTP